MLDSLPLGHIAAFRAALGPWLREHNPDMTALSEKAEVLPAESRTRLKASLVALVRSMSGGGIEGGVP